MEGAPKDDELSTFTMIENNTDSNPPNTILIGDTGLSQTSFSPFGPGAIPVHGKSNLASIIGVCVFIVGMINLIASAFVLSSGLPSQTAMRLTGILAVPVSIALIYGGFEMTKYKKRGVQIALLSIVCMAIFGVVEAQFTDEIIDEQCEEGQLTQEECENLAAVSSSGIITTLSTVLLVVCYGFCGLLVAIPLMMVNGGLDDTSLFKS
jgi:hypothetical protein